MRSPWIVIAVSVFLLFINPPGPAAQSQSAARKTFPNAIVGTVTDPSGHPVRDVFVTVLQEYPASYGQRRVGPLRANFGVHTNERGEYVLDQVRLGPCYVVAIPQNVATTPDGGLNRQGWGITYYPGTASRDAAKLVTVTVDGPVTADITLTPAALSIVAGTVIGSNQQPAAGGQLHVAHGNNLFGVHSAAARLAADGSFRLPPMPPGTYFLQFREGTWPPPRGETPLISAARVDLDGRDVIGVRVAPIHMVQGSGRIVIDPSERASLRPSDFSVGAFPVDVDGNPGPQRPGTVGDDLTFEFATWPAVSWVRLSPEDGMWHVKSVRHNGRDVTQSGIPFREGQPVTGIEVELVRR